MNSSAIDSQKISNVPQPANSQSFNTKARFAGWKVFQAVMDSSQDVTFCMAMPFGLIGAVLGGFSGLVGGSLYKAARHAMGQGAQTKKLGEYVINSVESMGLAFALPAGCVFVPITIIGGLAVSACGVVGASVGALATPVVAPIYKMVKECRGESVQDRELSDYVIKSAELGAKGSICLSVFGLAGVVIFCCPPAAILPLLLWPVTGCALLRFLNPSDDQGADGPSTGLVNGYETANSPPGSLPEPTPSTPLYKILSEFRLRLMTVASHPEYHSQDVKQSESYVSKK